MGKNILLKISSVLIAIFCLAETSLAEPTDITVRVISRDAKFIGSSMGGVLITLRDAETGEIFSQGKTEGGTGDTNRIIKEAHTRGVPLSTESAAKFSATLDLNEPRPVEVVAYGPLSKPRGANRVSAVQWVVPGKHLTGGDGWLLEMPGFVVDILAPPRHLKLIGDSMAIELKVHVTMMCGCPIKPGGLWDANRYEVVALIKKNGEPAGKTILTYAGATSEFAGKLQVEDPGTYEATIYAYDSANGNTGLDKVTFIISN